MDNSYAFAELSLATVPEGAVDDRVRIKAIGPTGESKWISVTPERFEEIVNLFKD